MISRTAFCSAQAARMLAARTGPMPSTRNYEDLLDRLKAAAGNLFRARGETVTDIKIIPSERPALQVFH